MKTGEMVHQRAENWHIKTGEKVHQKAENRRASTWKREKKYIKKPKTGELVHENRRKSTSKSMTGLKVVEVNVHIQGVSTENMESNNQSTEENQ